MRIGSYCIYLVLFTMTIDTYYTVFYFPILHPDLCIIFFNIRPTCEMGLWVELKEEEQRKGVEGWEKEIENLKTKPKTFSNISPFRCIYHRTPSTEFWYMDCARRKCRNFNKCGSQESLWALNAILINLCLSVYGHRGFHFPGKCRYNDRCVNVVRCILDTIYRSFNKQQTFKICLSIRELWFDIVWLLSFFYNLLLIVITSFSELSIHPSI